MTDRKTSRKRNSFRFLFTKENILTIPNAITLFRLLLIPVFMNLYLVQKNYTWTGIVIVLSALSDVADGRIARHFNMISEFGKAFDPIVDKLTQAAMLFCLVKRFPSMLILLIFLFVKEITTGICGAIQVHMTSRVIQADWLGKVTTVLLYASVLLHLVWPGITEEVSEGTVTVCAVMMLLAFIHYVRLDVQVIIRAQKEKRHLEAKKHR